MFSSIEAARQFLRDAEMEPYAERLLPLLRPCLGFVPIEHDRVGGSRIGGLPDMPPELTWPMRAAARDPVTFAAVGGSNHGEWIAKHMATDLPYGFVAQIDLAEAARFLAAKGLPKDGRLLFFYDDAVGPWHGSSEAGRVVWDRSPVDVLHQRTLPEALAAMDSAARAEHEHRRANPMEMTKDFLPQQLKIIEKGLKDGQTLEEHFREILQRVSYVSCYLHPATPVRIASALQWPDVNSPEGSASSGMSEVLDECGLYGSRLSNPERAEPWAGRNCPHILFGVAIPEQDDPRYDVVLEKDEELAARLRSDDRPVAEPILEKRASEWRLLLQIDTAGLRQEKYGEGIVCFVIHRDDLAAGNFSKTKTIYQQT